MVVLVSSSSFCEVVDFVFRKQHSHPRIASLPLRSLHITHPLITARTSTLSPHRTLPLNTTRTAPINNSILARENTHARLDNSTPTNNTRRSDTFAAGHDIHIGRVSNRPPTHQKVLHIIITLCARADDSVLILLARQVIKKALNTLRVREALYGRILDNAA